MAFSCPQEPVSLIYFFPFPIIIITAQGIETSLSAASMELTDSRLPRRPRCPQPWPWGGASSHLSKRLAATACLALSVMAAASNFKASIRPFLFPARQGQSLYFPFPVHCRATWSLMYLHTLSSFPNLENQSDFALFPLLPSHASRQATAYCGVSRPPPSPPPAAEAASTTSTMQLGWQWRETRHRFNLASLHLEGVTEGL